MTKIAKQTAKDSEIIETMITPRQYVYQNVIFVTKTDAGVILRVNNLPAKRGVYALDVDSLD